MEVARRCTRCLRSGDVRSRSRRVAVDVVVVAVVVAGHLQEAVAVDRRNSVVAVHSTSSNTACTPGSRRTGRMDLQTGFARSMPPTGLDKLERLLELRLLLLVWSV